VFGLTIRIRRFLHRRAVFEEKGDDWRNKSEALNASSRIVRLRLRARAFYGRLRFLVKSSNGIPCDFVARAWERGKFRSITELITTLHLGEQPAESFHSREHYCVAPRSLSLEGNDNAGQTQSNGARKKAKAGEVRNREAMACDELAGDREQQSGPSVTLKRTYPTRIEGDGDKRN